MFVIFGTRGVTTNDRSGSFFCPRCQDDRDYDAKKVRRFFTLFFIPVIPLDLIGEYVECSQCKGTYEMSVLSYDPRERQREVQAEFQKAIRGLMIHMLLADGTVDDAELETAAKIYEELSGQAVTPEEIGAEAMQVSASEADPRALAARFGPLLNTNGKEIVVKAGALVAAADGTVSDEELDLLGEIATELEMSSAHFRGVMSSVLTVPK